MLSAKLGVQYFPMCLFRLRKRPSTAHFKPQDNAQVHKWGFIWRTLVFVVLELAFLALATFCFKNPIPILPSSTPQRILGIAKAIMTSIAVIWHTIALLPIKNIISTIFSAECIAQYRRTGRLQPNVTDRVSCITSGLLSQIPHFLTPRSTMEYRLAFLLVLLTMALAPLGPSVIGVGPAPIIRHGHLQIANLTLSKGFFSNSQYQCAERADEIVYFEAVEGGTYGYTTQKQFLIPWPNPDFEESQTIIKYESDVVLYDYDCRWSKFRFDNSRVVILETPNISWIPWNGRGMGSAFLGDRILPLLNVEDNPPHLSAFIFVSRDSMSFDPLGTVKTWVSVSTDTSIPSNNITDVPTITFGTEGMAATLLCDPHYTISKAEVTLKDGQLHANLLNQPPLGNFPPSAANSMFSQALMKAFSPALGISSTGVFPFTTTMDLFGSNKTLLTLPEINNNLNRIVQSAAEAYISGYTGYNGQLGVFPDYTSFNQTATMQYLEISLVSNLPFVVALWVIDGVIILILAILMYITHTREMWLFSLRTMETLYRDLPTGDEDSTSPQHPPTPDSNTTKLDFFWRVLVFMVLELSFLALTGYCSAHPIPIHLPPTISPSQAKPVTTAIVVAWRTLAVFPIKDIILLVFSAECIAQYRRTGHLEPDVTDQVSHATSGLMDQISHFLMGWPTLGYRLAFLLVVLVTLIGPLGPGVLTLSDVPTTCPQELLVTNLSTLSIDPGLYPQRAQLYVELELLEGRVYGYDTVAEGVLIPWPEPGLERSQNVTVYESDVVVYNYSCRWTQVDIDDRDKPLDMEIVIPIVLPNLGSPWNYTERISELPNGGISGPSKIFFALAEGIFPLRDIGSGPIDIWPHHNNPLLAVAFTGNSSFMDLEGTGASISLTHGANKEEVMLLSVLLCDPRYKIQRANVSLSSGQLRANILPTLPLLGNFPKNVADCLFSQALLYALSLDDLGFIFTPISMLLFTGESDGIGPLHPFPLSVINDNMNRVMKSAAKAYLSGYRPLAFVNDPPLNYTTWSQMATVQYQQTALVASRPFLNVLLALVIVTVVILAVLLKVVDIGKVELFHLQTLKKIYKDEILVRDD